MKIAGYCRISVDEEADKADNTSIENQKAMIGEYVAKNFPGVKIDFYQDRDRSGYTFAQREQYQTMRRKLIEHEYDILVVKDFSRFSRRNSLGLLELETLRDYGVRIISIGDCVDYPKHDDWLNIQFRFLMNEMPVTDSSKKVRNVVKMKQSKGEWVCNAPYGYYIHPLYKGKIFVDKEGAEVVRLIFKLYNQGWGYKRIANYLTQHKYPTGLELMEKQIEQRGGNPKKISDKVTGVWSHNTVAKIVTNDFYIGTLRQGVWTRKGINKTDRRTDPSEQYVFENHHEAIVSREDFELARQGYSTRSKTNYKGIRKYPNTYSGFLVCGDCASPMFSISNGKRPGGYICGKYHRFGRKGCTSHHIREKEITDAVKQYITAVKMSLTSKIAAINDIKNKEGLAITAKQVDELKGKLEERKSELTQSTKQRMRQIVKNPENEELINNTFDSIEKELLAEIGNIKNRIDFLTGESLKKSEMRDNIDSVIKIFDELISKEQFTKQDIALILDKITVSNEGDLTIQLKADIDELLELL